MSEDIKKNPIELSDEEMDMVAGGNAMLISINGGGFRNCDICDYADMKPDNFYTKLYQGVSCRHWETDGHGLAKVCNYCIHYHFDSVPAGQADNFIQGCKNSGYEYKYI